MWKCWQLIDVGAMVLFILVVVKKVLKPFGAGIFFKNLAHPVFKMWILQEPKKIALWNKRHLEEREREREREREKTGEGAACLKYSVSIFVE